MWRNREVVRFLRWLRAENSATRRGQRVGFYGLDLYSLHRSMARVVEYLDKVDPAAARRARDGYACFDAFGDDVQRYGYAASLDLGRSCEDEVVEQLLDLRRRAAEYARRDGRIAADEYFAAEQNARVVCDAEAYYRAMFRGGAESWNLRDRHMMATLEALIDRAVRTGGPARAVVWAHNSHLGDARATGLAARGELNLGQLVRERFGDACCAIGMTTHDGDVTAAHDWDEPAALRRVRPSLPGSYERLFHDTGVPAFVLQLCDERARAGADRSPARASDRRDLPARDRTCQPLLRRSSAGPVRPRRARRSDAGARAAGEVGTPRDRPARNLSDRSVTWARCSRRDRSASGRPSADRRRPRRAGAPAGLVVFAHGSGSSRFSRRNRSVAQTPGERGIRHLVDGPADQDEEQIDARTGEYRFDIPRLGHRVVAALDWAAGEPAVADLPGGLLRREHRRRRGAHRRRVTAGPGSRGDLSRRPSRPGCRCAAAGRGAHAAHRRRA